MDDTTEHDGEAPPPPRARHSMSSKAIPYGTDEMGSFFSEEWETPWEINHTVVPPR